MTNNLEWDNRFMRIVEEVASWSKDRSTKVGCVIVDSSNTIRSTGYNGFPRGANDDIECRHERPMKYRWTEHAERNAIYNAGRIGARIDGCKMYLKWFPCMDCARAIVQSGISMVVCVEPDWSDERWGADFLEADCLLKECGVVVRFWDSKSWK